MHLTRGGVPAKRGSSGPRSAPRPAPDKVPPPSSPVQASVKDPDNELVHLYEIGDALAKKFGDAVRAKLGITRAQWSRFGRLANNEPLRQGRHRGKNAGNLRDATEGELQEARGIARTMIEAYLQFLENCVTTTSPSN